jgi:hypothetical protein
MSSESDYAWRMARYYGPKISRMTRRERIAFLEQRIAVLLEANEAERRAHEASCENCQKDEFCSARFSTPPHYESAFGVMCITKRLTKNMLERREALA